jgi:hypothetical protein
MLAERCQTGPSSTLAYHYCCFTNSTSQKPQHILGSFISQLAKCEPSLLHQVRKSCNIDQSGSYRQPPELPKLVDILCRHLNKSMRAYILTDALNESEDMSLIMSTLSSMIDRCPNLRVMITTTQALHDSTWKRYKSRKISLDAGTNRDDIVILTKQTVAMKPGLRDLSEQLKQKIMDTLYAQANGS